MGVCEGLRFDLVLFTIQPSLLKVSNTPEQFSPFAALVCDKSIVNVGKDRKPLDL